MIKLTLKDERQSDCVKDTTVEFQKNSIVFYNKNHSKRFWLRTEYPEDISGSYWIDNVNQTAVCQIWINGSLENVFEVFFKPEDFEKLFGERVVEWDRYWFNVKFAAWN